MSPVPTSSVCEWLRIVCGRNRIAVWSTGLSDYVLPLLQLCGREGVLWLATLVPVAGAGEDPPDMQVVLAETFNLAEQAGRTRLSEVCWAGVCTHRWS